MKDALETMGDVLPDDAFGRDAVHVAVFSATSFETLVPGQRVGIISPGSKLDERALREINKHNDDFVVSYAATKIVGIVDPFLERGIMSGERFWVYLFPRTITGLTHRWSHPEFEQKVEEEKPLDKEDLIDSLHPDIGKAASEEWLRNFCEFSDCPSYDIVMAKVAQVMAGKNDLWAKEYLHFDGMDAYAEIPPEFWEHVERIYGKPLPGKKPKYFSCSC